MSTITSRPALSSRPRVSAQPMSTLMEGVLAGLAGAAAVALWFLAADLMAGEPLRTPMLLGAVVFEGAREMSEVVPSTGLVVKYTALHTAAFVLFALAIAGLMRLADRDVRVFFVVFLLLCCLQVVVAGMIAALAGWLFSPIPLWSLVGANLFATVAMMTVIWPRHNVSWRRYVAAHDDD
jgi:hypothetical protein